MIDAPNQRPQRGMDLEILGEALRQQRWTVLLLLGAVLSATLAASLLSTRQYQAVALIQLMPRAGQEVDVSEVVKHDDAGYLEGRDRARTQIQIILSRTVSEEVVRAYNALGHDDLAATPEGADALRRSLSAGPREDTQLVEIRVLHPDPDRAAILANLVAEVYTRSNLAARTDAARETRVWLDGQTSTHRTALGAASDQVMAFKEAHDLVDIDEKVDGISTRLDALQAASGDVTTRRVLLESKLSEHRRLLRRGQHDVLAGMFTDPALETMATERATIVTEAAEVLSRYGDQHPDHQRAVARIQRVEALIAEEVKRNVDGERSNVETLRRQEREIGEELVKVKAELLAKQRLQGEYDALKQEEARAIQLYGSLGDRGQEVDLQASTRLNDVRVVDRAVPPTRPATPNIPLNMAMAFVVGLGGGLGLALLRHRMNETLLSARDVDHYLETPLLGVLPSLPAGMTATARALYAHDHPRSLEAESLRGIRAVLQSLGVGGPCRRILVTSCLPEEGKTSASVGIAIAFAQLGLRVLLIDGDLRLPRLHTMFGVPESPGFGDALIDEEHPQRFVVRTHIDRLHLLPRGAPVEYPNEFLSSPEVNRLLTRLCEGYRVVVIDTPPAALISDALVLARDADGVVMVVRRGRVARDLALKTLGQLRQVGARVLGVALNDVPRGKDTVVHGSHYYDDRASTGQ